MQSDIIVVSIVAVFFKKAAVIIAIHGQKTLHGQLSKVILSGMNNCKFEAINGIWAVHLHNHLLSDALYKT